MIYNGVRSSVDDDSGFRHDYDWKNRTAGRPYFMTLGSIHPRKNLKTVLDAFAVFKKNNQDTRLLVVGRMAWKTSDIRRAYENHPNKEQIVFTGYLGDREMFDALQGSRALIYISLFEGFGLPIVEAMSKGVPVITSNRSSMKEIAGNAALLVNPEEPKEVAKAMAELDINDTLRASLINLGKQRATLFSWHQSTAETWNVMHALSSP